MAVALGLTPATEPYPGTALLTPYLEGNVGLLFSPRNLSELLSYFQNFQPADFARAGTIASRTFTIPSGTLYSRGGEIPLEDDVPLAHSSEPNLRKLGMQTRLVKGKIELDSDFVVCREGEVLGSGQTTLLKTFGLATAVFRVGIEAYWARETGIVEAVEGQKRAGRVKLGDEDMDIENIADDVEV